MGDEPTLGTFTAPQRQLDPRLDIAAPAEGWTFPPTSVTLISGEREAILVDTVPTVTDSDALADWIEATGKGLTTVFITHGHFDHYLGATSVLERFPGARLVATEATVRHIENEIESGAERTTYSAMFVDELCLDVVVPEVLQHDRLELESEGGRRDTALKLLVRNHIRATIPLGRVTAADVARAVSISVRSLHRLFEAESSSFAACVREERLRGVMLDLVSSPNSLPLNKIAARWGFYDNSHLTRAFQRHLGCTPTEYRASGGRLGGLGQTPATPVHDSIGS